MSDWSRWEPGDHADALAMAASGLDYLRASAAQLADAALSEALLGLETVSSKLVATRAAILGQFDAAGVHDRDGHQNSSSWLRDKAGMSRPAARGQVKQMRSLRSRPLLADAMAEGWLSESYASSIIKWTRPLPPGEKGTADEILLGALRAGADLDDVHLLATAIIEKFKSQRPDPGDDPGDDAFEDRSVRLDTTMDGAGYLAGNLTPQAAAALNAVLESLSKKAGKEDTRTEAQRNHDGLLEACNRLLRSQLLPQRAGSPTRADVHIPFRELHSMEGAGVLEDAWLRAKSGEHGWLLGKDAEAAACDAMMIPIVTAAPEWPVINEMIQLVLNAFAEHGVCAGDAGGPAWSAGTPDGVIPAAYRGPGGNGDEAGVPRLPPLPAGEWERLLYALGKLAIKFVSGPGAIASVLRTGLLPSPFSTRSVPIDIGYSDRIPEPVRRGVAARSRGRCEWPGGCDRPAAVSDVHHLKHKSDGGPTSVSGCGCFCEFHHLVCIHRWGWQVELRADGVMIAYGPDGQALNGHPAPGQQGPPGNRAA
ncbi:MAG: DUF222 domain-containing protein [Nocardiopsaceae bacterium]|nr:DUF222 domain-containing protein [Nocardiopsaceae bacterium]